MHDIPTKIISETRLLSHILLQNPVGSAVTLALRGPEKLDVPGRILPEGYVEFDAVLSLSPGRYWWQILSDSEHGSTVYQSGQILVTANYKNVEAGFDGRTAAEKMLEAVEAALLGTADEAVWTIQINGRQLQFYSVDQLKKLRAIAVAKVRNERGQNKFRSVAVRL